MRRKFTIAVAAVLLAILIGSYGYVSYREQQLKQQQQEAFEARQKEFRKTITWLTALNPSIVGIPVRDSYNGMIIKETYDALVRYEGDSVNLSPCLATRWEISPDGKIYTFYLRQGVKFYPSGDPFNAETAKWTLDNAFDPTQLHPIEIFGAPTVLQYDRTEIVDQYTIKVYIKKPVAWFLSALAYMTLGGMANPKFVDAHGGPPKSEATIDPYLIWHQDTTAAYTVDEFVRGDHVTLKRNPTWWGGWTGDNAKRAERIVIRYVPEPATRIMLLARGDADLAYVDLQYLPELKKRIESEKIPLSIDETSTGKFEFILIDHKNLPTSDIHIRKMLAWSFNYDQYIKGILQGLGDRMTSYTPVGWWGHLGDVPIYTFDLDKAKAELALAAPEARSMVQKELKVVFTVGRGMGKEGLLLWKSDLNKIGVNLVVEELPTAIWRELQFGAGVTLLSRQWSPDYPDPSTYYNTVGSNRETVAWATRPAFIDDLLDKAAGAVNPDERLKIYRQVEEWAYENVLHVKVASVRGGQMHNVRANWVKGYKPNPLQDYKPLYYELWKELPLEQPKVSASALGLVLASKRKEVSWD